MLLVDFYNYVYDTVDKTVEKCSEDKLEILRGIGLVKSIFVKCHEEIEVTDTVTGVEDREKTYHLKVVEECSEYFNKQFVKDKLTGVIERKEYTLDIKKLFSNIYCLGECHIRGSNLKVEIPFYCFVVNSNLRNITMDYLKLYKKGILGIKREYVNCVYINGDNSATVKTGKILFENINIKTLDLSELNIVNTDIMFNDAKIDNLDISGVKCDEDGTSIETMITSIKGFKDLSKPIKQIEFIDCDTNAIRLVLLYLLFLGDDELDYIKIIGDNSKQQVKEVKEYLVRKWDIIYPCLDAIKDFKGLVTDRKLTNEVVIKEFLSTIILDE